MHDTNRNLAIEFQFQRIPGSKRYLFTSMKQFVYDDLTIGANVGALMASRFLFANQVNTEFGQRDPSGLRHMKFKWSVGRERMVRCFNERRANDRLLPYLLQVPVYC